MPVAVLTYHAQNCGGDRYETNDHLAFARDLELLEKLGVEILPLHRLVDACENNAVDALPANCVALTCDDGTLLDWQDYQHPVHGMQRSFAGLLREHLVRRNIPFDSMLTSFVIASPEARRVIDRECYAGAPLSDDRWWSEAVGDGLVTIGNHSFDHVHTVLGNTSSAGDVPGDFSSVDNYASCDRQVRVARELIERAVAVDGYRVDLFAYPYGQYCEYIRDTYFPDYFAEHGTRAAFTTERAFITGQSNRYALPRLVCGDAWRSEASFMQLWQ